VDGLYRVNKKIRPVGVAKQSHGMKRGDGALSCSWREFSSVLSGFV
jgi:hypothetical protein